MWSDKETEIDFLNFSSVAGTVAEIIVQAEARPISIGVSGAWGVGKSSMIKLIRRALEDRSEQNLSQFVLVEFNAWLYQGYDDARAALMEVIATTLEEEALARMSGLDKARELVKRVDWLRVAKLTVGSTLALGLGFPPIGLIGDVVALGKKAIAGDAQRDDIDELERKTSYLGRSAMGALVLQRQV